MSAIKLAGSSSGEITISAPAVAGTSVLTLPATTETLATQNSLGVRNLIINGDMRIAQRGTSASVSGTGFTYDTVDRWKYGRLATQLVTSFSQSTDVPTGQGFSNSLKLDVTTAETAIDSGDYARLQYAIEGQMLQHLKYGTASAESITLSFWVKSSKTGNYNITLYRDESTDRMNVNNIVTISSANTWEKKTITFDGDTSANITNDNGSRLLILLWLNAGSNFNSSSTSGWQNFSASTYASGHTATWGTSTSDDFYITGVQLEVGDTATPFEHRPYDMELQRCMRYYETGTAYADGYTTINAPIYMGYKYKVTKRIVPALTHSFTNGANARAGGTRAGYVDSFARYCLANATGALFAYESFTADAEL